MARDTRQLNAGHWHVHSSWDSIFNKTCAKMCLRKLWKRIGLDCNLPMPLDRTISALRSSTIIATKLDCLPRLSAINLIGMVGPREQPTPSRTAVMMKPSLSRRRRNMLHLQLLRDSIWSHFSPSRAPLTTPTTPLLPLVTILTSRRQPLTPLSPLLTTLTSRRHLLPTTPFWLRMTSNADAASSDNATAGTVYFYVVTIAANNAVPTWICLIVSLGIIS